MSEGAARKPIALGRWLSEWSVVLDAMSSGSLDGAHAQAVRDGHELVLTADPELDADEVVAELLEAAFDSTVNELGKRAESMAVEFIWLGLDRIRAGEHLA